MPKRISTEKLQEMYDKYPVRLIAKALGVSRQTVYSYLNKAGIELNRGRGKSRVGSGRKSKYEVG